MPVQNATRRIVTPADHVDVTDGMASLSAYEQDGSPFWRIDGGMPATLASKILTRCVETDRARIDELEGYFTDDGCMYASITGHAPLDLVQEFMDLCERHNDGLALPN